MKPVSATLRSRVHVWPGREQVRLLDRLHAIVYYAWRTRTFIDDLLHHRLLP
jgi:hypothetical protein